MYKILCVGKIKENFYTGAINEYLKRINGFIRCEVVEVKEVNTNDVLKNIKEEGNELLSKIKDNDFVVTLELEGLMLDSVELSRYLSDLKVYGNTNIVFVIGGSNGLSNEVKNRSNYKLSFSKFTFPHQLMRVILLEQIYRSLTIEYNKEYHK